jgi:hypothetical protein
MYGISSLSWASHRRSSQPARVFASAGDDGHQLFEGPVHGGADRARGAVHVLERAGHAFQEQHRPFRAQHRVVPSDGLDLAHRVPDTIDRRLRLPAERAPAEPPRECPVRGLSPGHAHPRRLWLSTRFRAAGAVALPLVPPSARYAPSSAICFTRGYPGTAASGSPSRAAAARILMSFEQSGHD